MGTDRAGAGSVGQYFQSTKSYNKLTLDPGVWKLESSRKSSPVDSPSNTEDEEGITLKVDGA